MKPLKIVAGIAVSVAIVAGAAFVATRFVAADERMDYLSQIREQYPDAAALDDDELVAFGSRVCTGFDKFGVDEFMDEFIRAKVGASDPDLAVAVLTSAAMNLCKSHKEVYFEYIADLKYWGAS